MENKLLVGSKQILKYLQITRPIFKKFIDLGLPAALINNRWYAHTDNVDDFIKAITKKTNT